ncbi:MAG: prolyl-tRNA synthetase associated domain-containing protein [Aristaeellaceae bacterium]
MSNKAVVASRLRALGIPFAYYEHEPAFTIAACLMLPYAAEDLTICKNILLCNRQQTAFYLYVTLPDKAFRTSEVSHALGSSRLSFAPENCLRELLELESGSLSPLGLWFDREQRVQLVFDRAVRRAGRIAFHPCDNTATCVFEQEVFWTQVVPSLGREPVWIE